MNLIEKTVFPYVWFSWSHHKLGIKKKKHARRKICFWYLISLICANWKLLIMDLLTHMVGATGGFWAVALRINTDLLGCLSGLLWNFICTIFIFQFEHFQLSFLHFHFSGLLFSLLVLLWPDYSWQHGKIRLNSERTAHFWTSILDCIHSKTNLLAVYF